MRNPRLLLAVLACLFTASAVADPPSWAPAHGRRDKDERRQEEYREHDGDSDRHEDRDVDRRGRSYRGYTGDEWADDHGITSGRCNTDTVLTVVGAVGGAVIGNRTASAENRGIATVIGAVLGGIAGNAVGDAIDDRDRACLGHAFEMAPVDRVVEWRNPRAGTTYYVKPVRDLRGGCREVEIRDEHDGQRHDKTVTACRGSRGAWTIRR
jgi:surface antigen